MLAAASDLTPVSWGSLWTVEGLVALGTLLVALGTLGLASVTAFLARRTSTMASQTAELADLTEKDVALARTAIEADVRPVLISVPPEQFVQDKNFVVRVPETSLTRGSPDRATVYLQDIGSGTLFISVPLRNEGAGIAFVSSGVFRWQGNDWPSADITAKQVPRHEFTRVSFVISQNPPTVEALMQQDHPSLVVTYADLAGNKWSSRLSLGAETFNEWRVVAFELSSEGRTDTVTS
jgi:hypothetical protein